MVRVSGVYIIPVWVHSGTTHIAQSSGKGNRAAALEADIAGMKESVVETSVDQKHESTSQPNQTTWVTTVNCKSLTGFKNQSKKFYFTGLYKVVDADNIRS